MLFKKLYYYYHHYKMWSYIVRQLKEHPDVHLSQLKQDYIGKNKCKHLNAGFCYLCDYAASVRTMHEPLCARCPLYEKYRRSCYYPSSDTLFLKVSKPAQYNISFEERIAAAKKIRDCVLFWKGGLK